MLAPKTLASSFVIVGLQRKRKVSLCVNALSRGGEEEEEKEKEEEERRLT